MRSKRLEEDREEAGRRRGEEAARLEE